MPETPFGDPKRLDSALTIDVEINEHIDRSFDTFTKDIADLEQEYKSLSFIGNIDLIESAHPSNSGTDISDVKFITSRGIYTVSGGEPKIESLFVNPLEKAIGGVLIQDNDVKVKARPMGIFEQTTGIRRRAMPGASARIEVVSFYDNEDFPSNLSKSIRDNIGNHVNRMDDIEFGETLDDPDLGVLTVTLKGDTIRIDQVKDISDFASDELGLSRNQVSVSAQVMRGGTGKRRKIAPV